MHTRFTRLTAGACAGLLLTIGAASAQSGGGGGGVSGGGGDDSGGGGGYLDHEGLTAAVNALDTDFEACTLDVIGASRQGRGLFVLTLAADPQTEADHPALLITAGLDGRHWVGTDAAVRVARDLLEHHADLLGEMTVYIIPRVNPDGAELNMGPVNAGHVGTLAVVDADRDGVADEDGPDDLNGDGYITQMRRPNPPLDDEATLTADPVEPRLLKKPDWSKSERATYSLYTEGLDDDGDGLIAEDGPGEVDLDRNFMHGWPEHEIDSGAYPLSEPEAHALATFVLEHRNIVEAITYGRHDTLVNPPAGKAKDITGRAPKDIDPGDVTLYQQVSKLYKETTGQDSAPSADSAGSFHEWLYAQRGIPSFATVVWSRPGKAAAKPSGGAGPSGGGGAAGIWGGSIDVTDMGSFDYTLSIEQQPDGSLSANLSTPMFAIALTGTYDATSGALNLEGSVGEEGSVTIQGSIDGDSLSASATGPDGSATPIKGTRKTSGGGDSGGGGGGDKAADAEGAAWLKYSDESRDGAGFVEWTPFDHPTLGKVEIGGFVPGFRMNPPIDEVDDLAAKQAAFAVELMGRRPKLSIVGPDVEKLASGLYDVRLAIVNDGYLPTATSMARTSRSVLPTIVRLSVPVEQIVTGDRVNRSWGIDGSGGRESLHWILRVDDGTDVDIAISNQQLGDRTITFTAE